MDNSNDLSLNLPDTTFETFTDDELIRMVYYLRRAARDNGRTADVAAGALKYRMTERDVSVICTSDGMLRAELNFVQTERCDVKALKENYPAVAEEVVTSSVGSRLTIR